MNHSGAYTRCPKRLLAHNASVILANRLEIGYSIKRGQGIENSGSFREKKRRPKTKLLCFFCFLCAFLTSFRFPISTLANCKRDPTRLIRPGPIDCDSGLDGQMKIFRSFLGGGKRQNKESGHRARDLRYCLL